MTYHVKFTRDPHKHLDGYSEDFISEFKPLIDFSGDSTKIIHSGCWVIFCQHRFHCHTEVWVE